MLSIHIQKHCEWMKKKSVGNGKMQKFDLCNQSP